MENSEEERNRPLEGEKSTKRKMKTAGQLELLEKTYLRESYPPESIRAELSEKLGLTDRQLQMWFCHRRLKDKKKKAKMGEFDLKDSPVQDDWNLLPENRKSTVGGVGPAIPRIASDPLPPTSSVMKRYTDPSFTSHPPSLWHQPHHHHHPQPSIAELHAISTVEQQLGEPLREDGPVLGIDFDPLPPDAFGRPIMHHPSGQPKHGPWQYENQTYERQDVKPIKSPLASPGFDLGFVSGSSANKRKRPVNDDHTPLPQAGRTLQEYQFLPEQPSGRSDMYESPIESFGMRSTSVPTGRGFTHSGEHLGSGYAFQGPASNVNIVQHGRHSHMYSSSSVDHEGVTLKHSFVSYGHDSQSGAHPVLRLDNAFIASDKQLPEEDPSRLERKRKSEEDRIVKEVEAHEKRIRKELEKQDILRRKREEQMRREVERQDRDRRKEEERLMRERQREEERFQREQRRELERREKFLQKESLRAEKMRHKEERRREKEAARMKAANERATARKIARESLELIEDERLELMELAASSRGLPSIISLDSEALHSLELFRDKLCTFPPKAVHLKAPFGFQPWFGSEENVANLLMVWRFLITFVDVLDLWPFTLDEFVQAFHDYDPRLLGEVHIALLKSIIKDIEDVARTPSVGLGVNQTSSANPGGGHPEIVEGAYAWGFDIRSWQLHLDPLTWPEVLRQFALSAGFGPRLKKSSLQGPSFRDDEDHDAIDVVSTLRSGAAAESAVAMMHERGFSYLRRSRHRLTPGTVKFAAFHVLSLEGSRGLTILEVADKIQRSGLRDLTTSKTPEASIAAALSRDANLFERTAPSTYCVRPAFRKDPADAEAILQAAREKIQIFQSALSDSEEAEKDAEDNEIEQVEDSESDVPDDPEVDEQVVLSSLSEPVFTSGIDKDIQSLTFSTKVNDAMLSNDKKHVEVAGGVENISSPLERTGGRSHSGDRSNDNDANGYPEAKVDHEDIEIDESSSGEPWVQGLMEGEYSDLSVEERLNALVSLIGVAIQGNSIRVVIEDRLEAANALKRQMWAEAQLDKRRLKEENMSKFQASSFTIVKADGTPNSAKMEDGHSPLLGIDYKMNDPQLFPQADREHNFDSEGIQTNPYAASGERNLQLPMGPEISPLQQSAFVAEKSRSQLKAQIGRRAEELYVYRSLPLGQDRRRNRYWQFVTFSRNDPGYGRIFFESKDGCWSLLDTEEDFDTLLSALDVRGTREAHLHSILLKIERSFKDAIKRHTSCLASYADLNDVTSNMAVNEAAFYGSNIDTGSPSSTVCGRSPDSTNYSKSFKIDLGWDKLNKADAIKRYHDVQRWAWVECLQSSNLCAKKYGKKRCSDLLCTCEVCYELYLSKDKHCGCCHKTFDSSGNSDVSFAQHVNDCEHKKKINDNWKFHGLNSSPFRVQLLKALLALLEVSLPSEALKTFWTEAYRKSWTSKLQNSSSSEDLIQALMMLEAAVKRDYLSQNFETAKEFVSGTCYAPDGSYIAGSISVLPWMPRTTAAVALRVLELDGSISYMLSQRPGSKDEEAEQNRAPSRFTVARSVQYFESLDAADETEYHQENRLADARSGRALTRGRGGRPRGRGRGGRGGRGGRMACSSRPQIARGSGGLSITLASARGRKGRSRGRGRGRGSRTVRGRPLSSKTQGRKGVVLHSVGGEDKIRRDSNSKVPLRSSLARRGWNVEEEASAHLNKDDESGASDLPESDENEHASEDDFDGTENNYSPYGNRNGGVVQDSEEEDECAEEDDGGGETYDVDDNDEDEDADSHSSTDADDLDVDGGDDEGIGDDGGDDDDDGDEDDQGAGSSPVYYSD